MSQSIVSWNDEWLIGVDEIDNDHKKLIGMIHKIMIALLTNQSQDEIIKIYDELLDYTRYHFKREEKVFEEMNYPDKEGHTEIHARLFLKAADLYQKAIVSPDLLEEGSDLFDFLNNWMVDHILDGDMKFRDFYVSKKRS